MFRIKNKVGGIPVIIDMGHVLGTDIAAFPYLPQAASSTYVFYENDEPLISPGMLMGGTYPILAAGMSSVMVELQCAQPTCLDSNPAQLLWIS